MNTEKQTVIRWKHGQKLGEGDFSMVFAARCEGGKQELEKEEAVIKVPKFPIKNNEMFSIYRKHMVRYNEMMKNHSTNFHVEIFDNMVTEYLYEKGTPPHITPCVVMKRYKTKLRDVIEVKRRTDTRFEFYEIYNFIWYFLKHINHLRKKDVVSGEFNLDNIFYDKDDNRYIFPDFAIPKRLKEDIMSMENDDVTFDFYAPPEQNLTYKSDIYTFGVILYEMVTRQTYKERWIRGQIKDEHLDCGIFGSIVYRCTYDIPSKRPELSEIEEKVKEMVLFDLTQIKDQKIEDDKYNVFYLFCPQEVERRFPSKKILS